MAAWAAAKSFPEPEALQVSGHLLARRDARRRAPRVAARQASAELPEGQQWEQDERAPDQAQRAWAPRLPLLVQPVQRRQVQAEQVAQARQRPVQEALEAAPVERPA